jgi:Zn-dependent oligopeptidase
MVATPDLQVRRLLKADDRSQFHCGDPDLDRFFHRYAGQNQFRHHIGTTFVAVREGFSHVFASGYAADYHSYK